MWHVGRTTILFTCFLAFRGWNFSLPKAFSGQSSSQVVAGEVVSTNGLVFIRPERESKKSQSAKLLPAKPGDALYSGDVINTSSIGSVKILLKDKSIIDIGPSSLFKVDRFVPNNGNDREVEAQMAYGTVRAAITKKLEKKGSFKIRTSNAVMGVRGTEFIVKSDVTHLKQMASFIQGGPIPSNDKSAAKDSKTEVTVVQGKVDVQQKTDAAKSAPASARSVTLTAGTQLVAKQGDAVVAKPVFLPPAQLAKITETVKLQDNTFQKSVVIDSTGKDSGTGEFTKAMLGSSLALPSVPPVAMGNAGFNGTFNVINTVAAPAPVNVQAGNGNARIIHVVIRR